MTISIKLYICKSHEKKVQQIIYNELLSTLKQDYISIIHPINPKFPYLYEKYETTNKSGIILYINIPIKVNKKQLLSERTGYNYITRSLFSSKYISKYLQNKLIHQLFWYFHYHTDINMKSTSLKYLHVNPL